MDILKKLFGSNKNKLDDNNSNKLDLGALLASSDVNGSIIELDNYICKLASWGDTVENLTKPQRYFYFNQDIEREVNNGGFAQFFFNSSGKHAHETVLSLQAIGALKTADLLKQAIAQFPEASVPKDREERTGMFRIIMEKANPVWNQLDKEFYTYEDNLNELNLAYVKQNRQSF